jgi:virginiamycin B lyase
MGQRAIQTFTLANSGGQATGALTVTLAGAAAFTASGDTCTGASLAPGGSCTVTVRFAPASVAPVSATLTAASTSLAATATATLTGTGVLPSHIYWVNFGNPNFSSGTVNVANLDGTGPRSIVTGQSSPWGVAADSRYVYWSNTDGGTVNRANLDGSNRHAIVTGQVSPNGVAADGSYLYWANVGRDLNSGTIWRANPDGTDHVLLVAGQNIVQGVAVNTSYIYWVNQIGVEAGNGSIWRANLDGVAVDATHLYWTNAAEDDSTINRANLDGTSPRPIVPGQDSASGVAVGF